jgi:DNA-binding transcriptional MerR regulator
VSAPEAPVLLSAETAATFAGVAPATLRVWRHRYGLTPWEVAGRNVYSMDELAAIIERRARAG